MRIPNACWAGLFSVLSFSCAAFAEAVPDFVGMTAAEARTLARDLGFEPTVVEVSSAARLGRVYSQIPSPGTDLDGGEVLIRVSAGRVIPPVRNKSLEEVMAILEDLEIGWIIHRQAEPGVRPGIVFRSDPPEGQVLNAADQVVFLTVSNTELVEIPNLAGTGLDHAIKTLSDLGMVAGKGVETLVSSEPAPVNVHWTCITPIRSEVATSTNPPAGSSPPKGAEITVNYNLWTSYRVEPCSPTGEKL